MTKRSILATSIFVLLAAGVTFAKYSRSERQPATSSIAKCGKDSLKQHFVETCAGAMQAQAMRSGQDPRSEKIKEECRCVALNFQVENVPENGSCEFNVNDVYTMMGMDVVKLKCR